MQKGLFMAEHSFVSNCECEKDKRRNEQERRKKLCKFYQNFNFFEWCNRAKITAFTKCDLKL